MSKRNITTINGINYVKESEVKKYIAARTPKKTEYSKNITAAVFVMTAICITADYTLTALGFEVHHAVTQTVLGILAAVVTGYFGKSFAEKHSRNIHDLDENGDKIDMGGGRLSDDGGGQ